jgi:hypothetical protein
MARTSLRTLRRRKLPRGRFSFKVSLVRSARSAAISDTNASEIMAMRDLLRRSLVGKWRLDHENNWARRRVYTHLYLESAQDLALLKLVHGELFHRIYKISLDEPE